MSQFEGMMAGRMSYAMLWQLQKHRCSPLHVSLRTRLQHMNVTLNFSMKTDQWIAESLTQCFRCLQLLGAAIQFVCGLDHTLGLQSGTVVRAAAYTQAFLPALSDSCHHYGSRSISIINIFRWVYHVLTVSITCTYIGTWCGPLAGHILDNNKP